MGWDGGTQLGVRRYTGIRKIEETDWWLDPGWIRELDIGWITQIRAATLCVVRIGLHRESFVVR